MGTARTVVAGALILAAGGCTQWEVRDDACVAERESDPVQRVINYADPELCDRPVHVRGPDYVRVPHPDD